METIVFEGLLCNSSQKYVTVQFKNDASLLARISFSDNVQVQLKNHVSQLRLNVLRDK